MRIEPPDGYFGENLIVFEGLHRGGFISRGFEVVPPDLEQADPVHHNAFESALVALLSVLKPGGRFLCLEFSKVEVPGLDTLYDAYSFKLMPKIGGWVAKDEESYRYLAESIRRFPPQARFAQMIGEAGLEQVKVRNLSGGIAAMHSAWRL